MRVIEVVLCYQRGPDRTQDITITRPVPEDWSEATAIAHVAFEIGARFGPPEQVGLYVRCATVRYQ